MATEHDRVPPSNVEAERCVVGSVLLDSRVLEGLGLTSRDFYQEALGMLFDRLKTMHGEGVPLEMALVVQHLKEHGEWWDSRDKERPAMLVAVDAALLAECVGSVAVAAHARYYAAIVVEASFRRRVIGAALELIRRAYDPQVSVEELRSAAERLLEKMAGRHRC